MATRCYLSCTLNEELVNGHCLIVPIQHHLTMLDGDDDMWDEVRVRFAIVQCSMSYERRSLTVEMWSLTELHEMPHSHVCGGRQRCRILRDSYKS